MTKIQSQKISLSICIATLNQAKAVDHALKAISSSGCDFERVEIIILDDSDNQNTENIILKYANTIPVRYYKGEKKGVDDAFLFLTVQARNDYVWWFGDDYLNSDSTNIVLNYLEKYIQISIKI